MNFHWIFHRIVMLFLSFCVVHSSLFIRVSSILSDKLNILRREHHENSHETELLHSMFILVMIFWYFPLLSASFLCSHVLGFFGTLNHLEDEIKDIHSIRHGSISPLTIHPLNLPTKSVQLFFNSFTTAGKYAKEWESFCYFLIPLPPFSRPYCSLKFTVFFIIN